MNKYDVKGRKNFELLVRSIVKDCLDTYNKRLEDLEKRLSLVEKDANLTMAQDQYLKVEPRKEILKSFSSGNNAAKYETKSKQYNELRK